MRSEWHFLYELQDYAFGRTRRFRGGPGLTEEGEERVPAFNLTIIPDSEPNFPGASETGKLHVELPGDREESKNHAIFIAVSFAQKVEFDHGPMKVHSGLVTGKRIAETPEEEAQIADAPYFIEAKIIEWRPPEEIGEGAISELVADPKINGLISTFNAARSAKNPIDRFMGYFRILEDIYCKSKHRGALPSLKASTTLFDIGYSIVVITSGESRKKPTRSEFNSLLAEIVEVRNHCSHLRSASGLGVTPSDPRVRLEIEPLLPILQDLAKYSIRRLQRAGA